MWYFIIYILGLIVGIFLGFVYGYRKGYRAIRGMTIPKGTSLLDASGNQFETTLGVVFETQDGTKVTIPAKLRGE